MNKKLLWILSAILIFLLVQVSYVGVTKYFLILSAITAILAYTHSLWSVNVLLRGIGNKGIMHRKDVTFMHLYNPQEGIYGTSVVNEAAKTVKIEKLLKQ